MIRPLARLIATMMLAAVVIAFVGWSALAIWFDGPQSRVVAGGIAGVIAVVSIALAVLVRPFLRGLVVALMPAVVVALWWTSIVPSNTREWTPDVAHTAHASFSGSQVTIKNVRDFEYRSESDFDQRWETRTFDLDRIRGVDLFSVLLGTDPNRAHDRQLGV